VAGALISEAVTIFENFRIVAFFAAIGLIFSCTKSDPIVGTSCEKKRGKSIGSCYAGRR
jgi:hypothetical protein